ncbi:olfactory receptor 5B12-like isoform X1 [Hippopotamus amphibius kiboko]|uniref:olfactory receptor 5B12-like isoform X1 n=1 Tax=Hippopotamus amphibius kiboko TaxID=575201 RepID=UPI0025952E42|nr:olfactory receptor 5B12-like isoform X1 [Hippopotamus amphibius kiboko]
MTPKENSTEVTVLFILAGITDAPELQLPRFLMFALICLITLVGSLAGITLVLLDSCLHTPTYFFLSHLSLADFGYSTAVTPKGMAGFLTEDKVISYDAHAAQFVFLAVFLTVETLLLASMAYDHHAAVCKPLHYSNIVTARVCAWMVIGSYVLGFLEALVHTWNTFSLSFCKSNVIDHFFCDATALLAVSCSENNRSEMVLFLLVGFNVLFSVLVILVSYLFIFATILRMESSEGHQKAFSTCASHLTAMSIFYGAGIFMYLQPGSSHTMDTDKIASVFCAIAVPMLNPLIYSLRNKEAKIAFKKAVEKAKSSIRLKI